MTEILKSFNKNNSGPFDGFDKDISPVVLGSFEEEQWEEQDGRRKYDQQVKEPDDMYQCSP
jgi:hypothetical protein